MKNQLFVFALGVSLVASCDRGDKGSARGARLQPAPAASTVESNQTTKTSDSSTPTDEVDENTIEASPQPTPDLGITQNMTYFSLPLCPPCYGIPTKQTFRVALQEDATKFSKPLCSSSGIVEKSPCDLKDSQCIDKMRQVTYFNSNPLREDEPQFLVCALNKPVLNCPICNAP